MGLALCVVGCGQYARTFSRAMQSISGDIQLLFASRDPQRAADYAAEFNGIGSFGSYQGAADDPRVDAMYLCTPHHLHYQHTVLAAAAGKHILVEKPIARTPIEANAVIEAADRAGVTLMVAENYRFLSGVRLAKELIESGAIGELRLIQLQEEADFKPALWRNNRGLTGGGVFIDGGIHKVDLLRYLAGAPETIYAAHVPPGQTGLDAEDGLVMITRSATGVVGIINHSWTLAAGLQPMWISVSGTKGRIYFQLGAAELLLDDGRSEQRLALTQDHYGLVPMVLEFRDSIREGRAPQMSGLEGLADVAIVLKAYESMETGRTVRAD